MKKSFLVVLCLGIVSAFAHSASAQVCHLVFGQGPVLKFEIAYQFTSDGKLSKDADFVLLETNNLHLLQEKTRVELSFLQSSSLHDIEFYSAFAGDWAAARVGLAADDDGVGATVRFLSDGPSTLSFYRCDQFPEGFF